LAMVQLCFSGRISRQMVNCYLINIQDYSPMP
jgi:hypothetical protein